MQPGTYGYFCEPHPQMTGTIVVQYVLPLRTGCPAWYTNARGIREPR